MKILDMLSTAVGVLHVSKVVESMHNFELMDEEERENVAPIVAFDYGVMTQENADTFPLLICRDIRYG